jgi:hypothetical protein
MTEKRIEVLLVLRDDHGEPFDPPRLLVGDRWVKGDPHPNGMLFVLTVDLAEHRPETPISRAGGESRSAER